MIKIANNNYLSNKFQFQDCSGRTLQKHTVDTHLTLAERYINHALMRNRVKHAMLL